MNLKTKGREEKSSVNLREREPRTPSPVAGSNIIDSRPRPSLIRMKLEENHPPQASLEECSGDHKEKLITDDCSQSMGTKGPQPLLSGVEALINQDSNQECGVHQ